MNDIAPVGRMFAEDIFRLNARQFADHAMGYAALGLDAIQAAGWANRGFLPGEAANWIAEGFGPDEASKWANRYIGPAEARRRTRAGTN